MIRRLPIVLIAFALSLLVAPLVQAQQPALPQQQVQQQVPRSWADKDTGHRIYRITEEPGSSGFYFNVNAYSPDGKLMAYNAPDGIHVLDLTTMKTRLLVANPPRPEGAQPGTPGWLRGRLRAIVVGRKTPSVFFQKFDAETKRNTLYKADMVTGQVTKLVTLPARASVATINADETLGAGVYDETEAGQAQEYGRRPRPAGQKPGTPGNETRWGFLVQPENKGQMMERRLAARIPVVLFTIDLRTGKVKELLHSTDWIGHMLFSPTDPTLLMYCHEGPWQKVDRIWNIHTDGTHNILIHKRTMAMEIAGHEFWGLDGKTIWYDWQYPKGQVFYLAGYNLETGRRVAYHMSRDEWSIHFNLTQDADLFTGDGGDPGQVAHAKDGEWIELFHPEMIPLDGALNQPDFWQPGVFHAEHLVNMAHQNYRLEPNVRFSPDRKMVFFTSNMFGPSYVFGVEVAKATDVKPAEVFSTPALATKFNPVMPTPVNVPAPGHPAEYQ